MGDEPFWMVYGDGQGSPQYKHPTRESAETEAKRLARSCPAYASMRADPVATTCGHGHPSSVGGLLNLGGTCANLLLTGRSAVSPLPRLRV